MTLLHTLIQISIPALPRWGHPNKQDLMPYHHVPLPMAHSHSFDVSPLGQVSYSSAVSPLGQVSYSSAFSPLGQVSY